MERILHGKKIFEIIPFDINSSVLFFPIRHHSPICSYHLLKLIDEYKPDCILVEGPENANHLIPVLTDENTVLPVAFYYYYKDSRKLVSEDGEDYKCYYPFLNASPEYNALLKARQMNIDCGFIDLPYGEILIHTAEDKGIRKEREIQSYNDDYYLSENKFFKAICEKTGVRNFDEFWERYFETDSLYGTTEDFIAKMYTDCYLIRENTPEEDMIKDGCIIREQYMAQNILKAAEIHSKVLVVTGGFHTPGLYNLVNGKNKIKKVKVHSFGEDIQNVYAMAYSFEAADALNGYASGMQNPGFYDDVWKGLAECLDNHEEPNEVYNNVVMDTLLKCAKKSNKANLLITMSDISSAVTMYDGLALIRDKKSPGLYELYDSVQSCFIKGEVNASSDLPIRFLSEIATGKEIGKLCDTAEKIPLMKDFEELSRKYRLKINDIIEQKTELDIFAKPLHMEISRFFYRLNFLKTGFAKRLKGADLINNIDRSRIREVWSYKRTVKTDSALIDYSAYGGTIEEVCAIVSSRFLKDEQKSGNAAKLYVECFLMGIDISENFADKMNDIIINDGDFFSLGKAVYYFNMLYSLRKMYGVDNSTSEYFLTKCFQKNIIMLPSMINVSPEDSAECIKICKMLYNIVSGDILSGEYNTLIETFKAMAEKENPEPALYGGVLGLIYGSDVSYKLRIENALQGYLSGTEDMRKNGASFLRGLFATARDIVLVGNEFVNIIDKLIKALPMDMFIEVLPELRLAFSYFTPGEIDSIAEKAAAIYNSKKSELMNKPQIYDDLYAVGAELEKIILGQSEVGK